MYLLEPIRKTLNQIFYSKPVKDKEQNSYILYKIVDSYVINQVEYFKVQYINTKAIMILSLNELIFDIPILYGLHPIQGCFIGIEYSKAIQRNLGIDQVYSKTSQLAELESRYGLYNLLYQKRNGLLGFENKLTNHQLVKTPQEIALSKDFISEFDVSQSFVIGLIAGQKIDLDWKSKDSFNNTVPYRQLKLVKN